MATKETAKRRDGKDKESENVKPSGVTAKSGTNKRRKKSNAPAQDHEQADDTGGGFTTEAEKMVGQALQLGPEAAEDWIERFLHGHGQRRRLPVFTNICA